LCAKNKPVARELKGLLWVLEVESRCGAVFLGRTYLFQLLSSGGALVVRPWLRFHIPLIEPYMQISCIKCGTQHFMRNVAPVDMWRSAPKVAAQAG
jgi:hypothetical protein